jgi:predicted nucleic acid-binding protein
MSFLLDTNVISELRKDMNCNPKVLSWMQANLDVGYFLSVMTLGEIRNGIELLRRQDAAKADSIEQWLNQIWVDYADAILPVTQEIADRWGRLNCPNTLPTTDSLITASAIVHGLTVVTRNVDDFTRSGVTVLNPFD